MMYTHWCKVRYGRIVPAPQATLYHLEILDVGLKVGRA
jgi:hypothetical protein